LIQCSYIHEDSAIIRHLFNTLFKKYKKKISPHVLIPANQHSITTKQISRNALNVLHRLQQHKFTAYLVGGCIRDIVLGVHPKDFDIATNATPEEIKKLFRNCIIIGRRFRLAHVRFGREVIEVTTFRAGDHKKSLTHRITAKHGMLLRDNIYGCIEEDVWRRDFTINALYYNTMDQTIIDYCEGMRDLKQRSLRIIGDPATRFKEDPVRLLRAIRFAVKLKGHIEPSTAAVMKEAAPLLEHVSPARLLDETLKLFNNGYALPNYRLLEEYNLFAQLFPQTAQSTYPAKNKWLTLCCASTDKRFQQKKTTSPTFLFASLLWPALMVTRPRRTITYSEAIRTLLRQQQNRIILPKRYTLGIQELWMLQTKFIRIRPDDISYLMQHPRFRAAYDFLLLRAEIDSNCVQSAQWWTHFITADANTKTALIAQLSNRKTQHEPIN